MIEIGFLKISWVDIVDILLVSYLIYRLYKLIKGSVAGRIFIGIISIYLVYLLVKAAEMELLTAILGQFIGLGVIAALILFQPEIRKFLLAVGKTSLLNNSFLSRTFLSQDSTNEAPDLNVEAIITAVYQLSATQTGGLIVIGQRTELQPYIDTGNALDAHISARLLLSIFFKNSPLHDGAAIITGTKIRAAGCILPVTDNADLPTHLGLRHRAAVGITELTDSLVVIVSEETGMVSTAMNAHVTTNLDEDSLRKKIQKYISEH